jgi:hypothetical protein
LAPSGGATLAAVAEVGRGIPRYKPAFKTAAAAAATAAAAAAAVAAAASTVAPFLRCVVVCGFLPVFAHLAV